MTDLLFIYNNQDLFFYKQDKEEYAKKHFTYNQIIKKYVSLQAQMF